MSFAVKTNLPVSYALDDGTAVSRMSNLLKACDSSTNLMVGVYFVERNNFFYCNSKLKEFLGYNYKNLINEGWDFLYSAVDPTEIAVIKNQITNLFALPYQQDLLTLKYHISRSCGKKKFVKHEIVLRQFENHLLAFNYFFDITEKEKIEDYIQRASKEIYPQSTTTSILKISPREKQVLRLIGDGFSSKEIANMLCISNHTAVSHRKNLIEKFQVKNTAHLIKKTSLLITA